MSTEKEQIINNYFRLRVFDDDLLVLINELNNSKLFSSKNDILNQALRIGIPSLYKEIFGKRLQSFGGMASEKNPEYESSIARALKEVSITNDDIFVMLNLVEYLVTTIYNLEIAKLCGRSVTDDEIRSGILSVLPEHLQGVKDELSGRHFSRRDKNA